MYNYRAFLVGLWSLLACILILSGCGGSGSPTSQDPTTKARFTAMATLETLQASLNSSTPAEISTQLAAKMATMPDFSESGVTPDHCAYGRFTDGRLIFFANNRLPAAETANYPVAPLSSRLGGGSLTPEKYRLIDTMGTWFKHPVQQMDPLLKAAGLKAAVPITKGSVEELMATKGDGFVYMDAHGGSVELNSGTKITAIWTSTKATEALDQTYKAMLDAGELVYFVGMYNYLQENERHYAMTPAFIRKYLSFGPNSVVFVNACHSGEPAVADAFKAAGAGVYMGWDDSTEDLSAIYAAYFVLDRTLGLFNLAPETLEPAKRQALDIQQLIAEMATATCPQTSQVYSTSRATNAKLKFFLGTETLGGLLPVINEARIDPESKVITLDGVFGATRGTVLSNVTATSAGTALPILTWSATSVTAQGNSTVETVSVKVGARSSKPQIIGGTFTLSGNPLTVGVDPAPFEIRSKLVVELNGRVIYQDPDGVVRGNRGPITFQATKSDTLKIKVFSSEIYGGLGEIYLTGPSKITYRIAARTLDYSPDPTTGLTYQNQWDLRYYF